MKKRIDSNPEVFELLRKIFEINDLDHKRALDAAKQVNYLGFKRCVPKFLCVRNLIISAKLIRRINRSGRPWLILKFSWSAILPENLAFTFTYRSHHFTD